MPSLISRSIPVLHERDPKETLLEKIGDLSRVEMMLNYILVAIYVHPLKTKSGIILTEKTQEESCWQSKVGLVVAMGPQAYQDDDNVAFDGQRVDVGDWVWFRPADGISALVNDVPCRLFRESGLFAKVASPDAVF